MRTINITVNLQLFIEESEDTILERVRLVELANTILSSSCLESSPKLKLETTDFKKEILIKARNILSGDYKDEELFVIIERIKKNKNQDELIDYTDGVRVREKSEYDYTCNEFLEEILVRIHTI